MFNRVLFARSASLLAALATTSIAVSATASAQENPVLIQGGTNSARTERVGFTSLDLSQQHDRDRLGRKVGAAVERVCLRDIGRDGLQDRGYYTCADRAWSSAAPQIADAIQRSRDIAMTGSSTIAVSAIIISAL